MSTNSFKNGATIHNNVALGKTLPSANTPYAKPSDKRDEEASKLSEVRDKFAPNADKPTTAAAEKGLKDILSALSKVDPNALSSFLKQFQKSSEQAKNILDCSDMEHIYKIVAKALYYRFGHSLNNNDVLLKEYLKNTDSTVWHYSMNDRNAEIFGISLTNILNYQIKHTIYETQIIPEVVYGDRIPSPLNDYQIPDLFVRSFYSSQNDPYPGYIEWTYNGYTIYSKRSQTDYPFETLEEFVIFHTSEYMKLFAIYNDSQIDTCISSAIEFAFDLYNKEVIGTSDIDSNSQSLIPDIRSALLNFAIKTARSFLNTTSMNNSKEKFSKNMTKMMMLKGQFSGAFVGPDKAVVGDISSLQKGFEG